MLYSKFSANKNYNIVLPFILLNETIKRSAENIWIIHINHCRSVFSIEISVY